MSTEEISAGLKEVTKLVKELKDDAKDFVTNDLLVTRLTNITGELKTLKRRLDDIESPPPVKYKKLSENASAPVRGSKDCAGADFASAEDTVIPAWTRKLVKSDIVVAVPTGHYGRLASRSSLASKLSVDSAAGTIDADYRGPVGMVIANNSDNDFKIAKGDRVAQMIIEKIIPPVFQEVDELDETERGSGGYGSTGVNQNDLKKWATDV